MNDKISAKIEKMKAEHQELINIARTQIAENSDAFANSADDVMQALNYDDESIKKYEAVKQAQELITSLTEQILHAQSVEEITLLRKKINYYINKIKAELKRRNVPEEFVNGYLDNVTSLRKSIALYIRFFKREDNIAKIDMLSENFETLTKEELIDFKKTLQKESRYNQRNINALNVENQEDQINQPAATPLSIGTSESQMEEQPAGFVFTQDAEEDTDLNNPNTYDENAFAFVSPLGEGEDDSQSQSYDIKYISEDTPYEETSDFFNDKINSYNSIFNVRETLEYNKGEFGKNTILFFRNIPRYIHNKFAIKEMEREFYFYYSGGDFAGYIEFMKKKNSIHEALKTIFAGTCLFSSEDEFIKSHEDCAKWMHDYCAEQSLPIWIRRRTTTPVTAE